LAGEKPAGVVVQSASRDFGSTLPLCKPDIPDVFQVVQFGGERFTLISTAAASGATQ
jgi:hypothetical protein